MFSKARRSSKFLECPSIEDELFWVASCPNPCTEILSVLKWTLSLDTKSVIFETAVEWHKTCDYLFFSKNNTHILLQMSEQAYNNPK